jgi:hypothetical protein
MRTSWRGFTLPHRTSPRQGSRSLTGRKNATRSIVPLASRRRYSRRKRGCGSAAGRIRKAELDWCEEHGIEKKIKRNRYLEATRPGKRDTLTHQQATLLIESSLRFPVQETTLRLVQSALAAVRPMRAGRPRPARADLTAIRPCAIVGWEKASEDLARYAESSKSKNSHRRPAQTSGAAARELGKSGGSVAA